MNTKIEWMQRVNEFGKTATPFLFIIDYLFDAPLCYALDALPQHILFSMKKDMCPKKSLVFLNPQFSDYKTYKKGYDAVQRHLSRGDSYLVNYTVETEIETTASLRDIYHTAVSSYKLLIDNECVVYSPETFIQISESGKIATFPMKGTIDAATPHAQEIILSDAKETAEHATIVDLLRNDLSKVAHSVKVEKYRYLDRLETNDGALLQVSSHISGQLETNWQSSIGDIVSALLPAGSVTGAPKQKTTEIISQAETHTRGYYTGVFGVFDGKKLDSAVMIRFIEQRDGKLYYKSGGGITTMSVCKSEYNEVNSKIYVPVG